MYSNSNYIYHRTLNIYQWNKIQNIKKVFNINRLKTNNIIKYIYEFFSHVPQLSLITYRLVVASDDQIFISPSSYCALIKRVDNAHVRYLLKPKQATFMKLHAVTAIRSNANHRPDNKCYLKKKTSRLLTGSKHLTYLENKQKRSLPKDKTS